MPANDLEVMLDKVGGATNHRVIEIWEKYRRDYPDGFIKYKNKFANYPQGEKIPQAELLKIHSEVQREITQDRARSAEVYSAAFNACKAVDAIAKISKMPELSEAVKYSMHSLDFAKQLGSIADIMGAGGGFAALANPTIALVAIGMQMMDCFMDTGPSYEEVMLLELREISRQIADLHRDMLREFGQVHEHLLLLHRAVLECTAALEASIAGLSNQMQGFRNDAIFRLMRIEKSIEYLRMDVEIGQRDLFLQDLKNLCTDVDARIDRHPIANEEAKVQKIAHQLERNWILGQSAAPSLTGSQIQVTYDNDIRALESSNSKLQNRLGYVVSVAQSMGFDLTATANIPAVERNKIIHLEIFDVAVKQYLRIRKEFPKYVQDDAEGSNFSNIQTFAHNTLNFIYKIQRSENLFNALFTNYKNAIHEVEAAIQAQIDTSDLEHRAFLQSNDISLRDDLATLSSKLAGRHPRDSRITTTDIMNMSGTTIHGARFPELNVQNLASSHQLNLPVEVLIAEALKLGNINCSYTAMYAMHINDPGIGVNYDSGLYTSSGAKLSCSEHAYTSRPEHLYARYVFKFKFSNFYEHTVSINKYENYAGNFWADFINPNLATYTTMANPAVNEHLLSNLRANIISEILQKRKELVAQRLLNGDSIQFEQNLQHLDSARKRLLSFGLIAGLPYEILQGIFELPSASTVRNDLDLYMLVGDINSCYWQKPLNESINAINSRCIDLVRAEIEQPSFDSPIAAKIHRIDALIDSSKVEYKNIIRAPRPRRSWFGF